MLSILAPSVSLPSDRTNTFNKVTITKERGPNPLPHTHTHKTSLNTHVHTQSPGLLSVQPHIESAYGGNMSNHWTHEQTRTPFTHTYAREQKTCIDAISAENVAKNRQLQTEIHLSVSCQRPALKMTLITNTFLRG